jgi:Zn-finger nucleic acid-binding protein
LRRSSLHGVEIELCTDCRGVFLDGGELGRICSPRPPARSVIKATPSDSDHALIHAGEVIVEILGVLLEGLCDLSP